MPDLNLFEPAQFSEDRVHRYTLCRRISMFSDRPLISCGYNPSYAAEQALDNTIRREIDLAKRLGFGVLIKVNVFAAVSPYPDELAAMPDPVGPRADEAISQAIELARAQDGVLLACWGTPKGKAKTRQMANERFDRVAKLTDTWTALRVTKFGHPEHPLYLPSALTPQPWPGYSLPA